MTKIPAATKHHRPKTIMTDEELTDSLSQIHSALTRIIMSESPGISPELLERLEDIEAEVDAVRSELASSALKTITTPTP